MTGSRWSGPWCSRLSYLYPEPLGRVCEPDCVWPAPLLTHQDPVGTRLAASQLAKESSRHSSDHHPTNEDFSLPESPSDCKLQKPADPVITLPGLPVAATTHADTLWWPAFLCLAKDG